MITGVPDFGVCTVAGRIDHAIDIVRVKVVLQQPHRGQGTVLRILQSKQDLEIGIVLYTQRAQLLIVTILMNVQRLEDADRDSGRGHSETDSRQQTRDGHLAIHWPTHSQCMIGTTAVPGNG